MMYFLFLFFLMVSNVHPGKQSNSLLLNSHVLLLLSMAVCLLRMERTHTRNPFFSYVPAWPPFLQFLNQVNNYVVTVNHTSALRNIGLPSSLFYTLSLLWDDIWPGTDWHGVDLISSWLIVDWMSTTLSCIMVKLGTCFGPVIIAQAIFVSCSVVLVAKTLFFLEGPRGHLLSEYNTQVY